MGDWKDTLFCWRGILSKGPIGVVVWRGAWVGSEDGELPAVEAFEQSANSFELHADGATASLAGAEVMWRGSYLLDNGDGLAKCEDWSHECAFGEQKASAAMMTARPAAMAPAAATTAGSLVMWARYLAHGVSGAGTDEASDAGAGAATATEAAACVVAAKGTTEFGKFISRGLLEGDTLTLCRRYVDDKDARLRQGLGAALAATSDAQPWHSLLTSLAFKKATTKAKSNKRKRK